MALYRKITPSIWNDEKFNSMSAHGQLAMLFMLTHPNMTALGAMRTTIQGLSFEHPKLPIKAFKEAFSKGLIKADKSAPLVWFPNFIKHNPPESPNVIKAWVKSLDLLPECNTKNEIIIKTSKIAEGFTEAFKKAFTEAFTEALVKANLKGVVVVGPNDSEGGLPLSGAGAVAGAVLKPSCSKSDDWLLSEFLYEKILENDSGFKKPNFESWSEHVEKLIRIDKRSPDEIRSVITWCQADIFWQSNILSTKKLRAKFPQLFLKMKTEQNIPAGISKTTQHNIGVANTLIEKGVSV